MGAATVSPDAIRHVLATCAVETGVPRDVLALRARFREPAEGAMGRAPVDALERVWAAAVRGQSRPLPARVARALPLERLGPFGFACLTAASGIDALRFAARAYPLISELGRFAVSVGRDVRLRLDAATPADVGARTIHEAMLSHFVVGLERVSGTRPRLVAFRHEAPPYAAALAGELGCAIAWGAPRIEAVIEREPLEAAPALSSEPTSAILREHVERELAALRAPRRWSRRVAASLERDAAMEAADIADALGVSERTLRRRLAREGNTLRDVRDALRRERALTWLSDPRRSVDDVALAIGFADGATFARAFRRWYGESPSAARKRATEGVPDLRDPDLRG